MRKNDYTIRLEREDDHREVEHLVREAFWNVYRPGCLEHYLLHQLRSDPDFVRELGLILEKDGEIIGQIAFVRGQIAADGGRKIPVLAMGPIGIAPQWQRQGYGKVLLDYALEQAAVLGVGAVCLEGNFDFYGKSDFVRASTLHLRYHGMPAGEEASFFLCRELIPGYLAGISGEYGPPQGYMVDEAAAEEFDKAFPCKKKEKLPGQLF